MKIEVRPLRDTDIEELSRIEAASFSMPWSAEDFRGLLLRDYCLYVVAETDGHIAGCAGLTDSFHEGNIDNVVTAPEYRNLGVEANARRTAPTGGRAWHYSIYFGSQSEQCTGDPFI